MPDVYKRQVTIHSDAEHLTWGELRPQIKGEVSRSIKEISGNYMTIVYDYEVECAGEQDETEVYQIQMCIRDRCSYYRRCYQMQCGRC